MAWRIDAVVIRGEIDNTQEGRTTGRIWLVDRDEPLTLDLEGDCWRDLAGTRLRFENSSPISGGEILDTRAFADKQTGIVGDMTASRKTKVMVDGARPSFEWRNALYLEWFSDINGRVVIESSDYRLKISAHEWSMDEDAEDAQKLANLHAMRDFMAQLIHHRETSHDDAAGELDEFAWEARLKESDRLTDAYQEVLEKYMADADSERKEAFVMGWDGLLDALAEREEAGHDGSMGDRSAGPMVNASDEEPDLTEDFGDERGGDDEHPLQREAQDLAMRAMDLVQQNADRGTPGYQLITCLLQVNGKLAGALDEGRGEFPPEKGLVLAILKRCLNWLNEAVGACQTLMSVEDDPDQLAALAYIRCSIFSIRDGIVELRREFK